jgi:DNA-binding cell septation regulator SpoVG
MATNTVLIRDLRVLQSKNRGLWIGEPEHTMPASGAAKYDYLRTVEFSPALKKDISDAVLNAYKAKGQST